MTATPDVPPSKGMMMIAVYRAARLRQRPVLCTNLHESHVALEAARCQGQAAGDPACMTAAEPASAFASLGGLAVPDKQTETAAEAPADTAPPVAQDPPPDEAVPAPREPVEPVLRDPPLAEIGFGPGMLIRLGQLGLRTTGDLARADANQLRAALGGISRLVDVEAWIASARMAVSTAPTDVTTAPEVRA